MVLNPNGSLIFNKVNKYIYNAILEYLRKKYKYK